MIIDYSWDLTKEDINLELDYLDEKKFEDLLWQARTGLNYETLCAAIETIIFMSDRPISINKIKKLIDEELPIRVIFESIEKLQLEYEQKHHGIRLLEVADGYQFRTKASYAHIIQKTFSTTALSLTPSALEVLAIITYKQPITKNDIENIRGVDSTHLIRTLMDKKLVKIIGRSEELGKLLQYGTTIEFLDIFNLAKIEDLPSESELMELATKSEVGKINEIKEIVGKTEVNKFNFDDFNELDDLSSFIKNVSTDTDFIKGLNQENKQATSMEGYQKRSAFDLLDEYVAQKEIKDINLMAAQSDTILNIIEAKVIPFDELDGYENVILENMDSEIEDDLDRDINFELENAESIEVEFEEESEGNEPPELFENKNFENNDVKESFNQIKESIDLMNNQDLLEAEGFELEKALDDAFDKLLENSKQVEESLLTDNSELLIEEELNDFDDLEEISLDTLASINKNFTDADEKLDKE